MTAVSVPEDTRADPVLARMRLASWRSLPALAALGLASLVGWYVFAALLGPARALAPVLVAVCTAPVLQWAIESIHSEVFAAIPAGGRYGRKLRRTLAVTGILAALAASTTINADLTAQSGQVYLVFVTVVALTVTVLAALVASVALPLALARPEVSLRAVAVASLLTVVRRPWGPAVAVLVPAALGWLGVTWFLGLLVFVAPAYAVLAVAGAWTSVGAIGVRLPELIARDSARTVTRRN